MGNKIIWSTICPAGEAIHLASVEGTVPTATIEHTHDFFECFLVDGGRGGHLVEGRKTPLQPGELHFIRPEHSHAFRSRGSRPVTFTNVAFSPTTTAEGLPEAAFPPSVWARNRPPHCIRLNTRQQSAFLELVTEVGMSPRSALDATWFLLGLRRLLRPATAGLDHPNLPAWMHEALPHAGEPEVLQEGLPRLIRLCGRTPEHVSRSFRRFLRQTPTQWLNRERIRYARRLLETTQHPIIEVAHACGFESPAHFHKHFKSVTGLTPLKFRKQASRIQSP